jgi:hypothetical protein
MVQKHFLELFRSGLSGTFPVWSQTLSLLHHVHNPTEPPLSPFIPKIQNPQIPSSQQYTYQTPTTPRIFTQNQHKSHQIFTQNHHKPHQTPTVEADHKETTYDLGRGERCETQGYLQSQIKTHAQIREMEGRSERWRPRALAHAHRSEAKRTK